MGVRGFGPVKAGAAQALLSRLGEQGELIFDNRT